jgi:hypothetical protein
MKVTTISNHLGSKRELTIIRTDKEEVLIEVTDRGENASVYLDLDSLIELKHELSFLIDRIKVDLKV